MASFLNKAKDKVEAALNSNNNKGDNPRSDNYGPHGSNVGNKVDPKVDSDLDNRNDPTSRVGGYGNTQAHDQYGTTGGGAGFATSDTYGSNTNNPAYDNPQSTNAGPHKSNLMNKLDPRADSDRDHRNDPTSRVGGHGNTQQYGDNYGTAGGAGGLGTSDTGYGNTGTVGHGTTAHAATTHEGHGHTGHGHGHGSHAGGLAASTTTGTSGYGAGSNTYDNPQSTTAGPHSSNMMNKVDPRVDSDRDHRNDPTSRVGGYGTQGEDYGRSTGPTGGYSSGTTGGYGGDTTTGGYTSGTTGGYGADTTTGGYGGNQGTHSSAYSGNTGGVGTGYGDNYNNTPGSGNASSTAGPHNSNILNKIDPRVDSDLDGSKTYGGNQTHR